MTISTEKPTQTAPPYSLAGLSEEAADQLVRYLYLLIDDIQFNRYDGLLGIEPVPDPHTDQQTLPLEFDDPIPF